jgi:hypothetical protein
MQHGHKKRLLNGKLFEKLLRWFAKNSGISLKELCVYGWESWLHTWKEYNWLRVLENKLVRQYFDLGNALGRTALIRFLSKGGDLWYTDTHKSTLNCIFERGERVWTRLISLRTEVSGELLRNTRFRNLRGTWPDKQTSDFSWTTLLHGIAWLLAFCGEFNSLTDKSHKWSGLTGKWLSASMTLSGTESLIHGYQKQREFYVRHLVCSMEDGPKVPHAISTYSAPAALNTNYKHIFSVYIFIIFDINLLQI